MMELHVTNLFKLFSGTDTSASRDLDFALVLVELAHVLVDTLTQLVALFYKKKVKLAHKLTKLFSDVV